MSKIRSNNTKVEKLVFRELRKRGVYFQKHYRRVLGNPDLALPRKKKAIFIDGDFWHGYQFKKLKKRLPRIYWLGKIERNIKRDRMNRRKLKKEGWSILGIWEHEILKDLSESVNRIENFIKDS